MGELDIEIAHADLAVSRAFVDTPELADARKKAEQACSAVLPELDEKLCKDQEAVVADQAAFDALAHFNELKVKEGG